MGLYFSSFFFITFSFILASFCVSFLHFFFFRSFDNYLSCTSFFRLFYIILSSVFMSFMMTSFRPYDAKLIAPVARQRQFSVFLTSPRRAVDVFLSPSSAPTMVFRACLCLLFSFVGAVFYGRSDGGLWRGCLLEFQRPHGVEGFAQLLLVVSDELGDDGRHDACGGDFT